MATLVTWIAIGYLAGSLPTGVLVGRVAGTDPRGAGSGNIGASNVTRTLGKGWGAFVLVVDLLKGALPTALAAHFAGGEAGAAAATAAVIGHCFPVWLRFNGGKGVATTLGAVLAIDPVIAVLLAVVWVAAVLLTHTPAIGSLIAATLLVVLPYVDRQPYEVHVFAVITFVVILVRHRSNLKTLKARRAKAKRRVLKRRKGQGAKRAKQARSRAKRRSNTSRR